jgi:hypothetical protein
VAEVRACLAGQRTLPETQVYVDLLTDKQEGYMRSLLEQVGEETYELPKPITEMTRREASEQITRLLAKKETMPKPKNPDENVAVTLPANVNGVQVPQGTYTVVFDAEKDDRITLRFKVPPVSRRWHGIQLVSYLAGPDNEYDYVRCANWTDDGYRVWARFKEDGRVRTAIEYLSSADKEKMAEAGYLYSLKSSNCYRCGRRLTVPASIHRGLGPDCAELVGAA